MFDGIVNAPKEGAPSILYHYTSWDAAKAILASRQFWATSHDCTNDTAELVSADQVIIEVAKELLREATGVTAEVLRMFIDSYSKLHVTRVISICLACFSESRDDPSQWDNYGDGGRGLCLGIKVVNEPPPLDPPTALIKVDYSESSWRTELKKSFGDMCAVLSRARASRHNLELGLNAFLRQAAFMSISAKQARWAGEREFRRVTLVTRKSGITLSERVTPDGVKRYLPVSVRTEGKLIALAEVIVGPNRNFEESRQEMQKYLGEIGYQLTAVEYPEFVRSAVPPL
ncbi:MAG TPA: hypothetical protein VHW45_12815 [Candidatus Sulfotelmatobacter sp.]|jgi:hypothetical protein|nr:hypothetical protein [Candidatus Sulfotelmatobacter sp.]